MDTILWSFNNGSKKYTPTAISSRMIPQKGYWFSVTESAPLSPLPEFLPFNLWGPKHLFTIDPQIGDTPLAYLQMGIGENANDEFGNEDYLPPPTIPEAGGAVYFLTPHENRTIHTVRDVCQSQSNQKWLIYIRCNPTYSFSLTWAPSSYHYLLEAKIVELDLETRSPISEVMDMKSFSSIHSSPNPTETEDRLFQVTLSIDPNSTNVHSWDIY